ncbi:MAG: class I SAM-dependent methyltransferase [Solobacterium sp.]|nr:class I SAM-dependent methyltransferase [Solobacterium sp.]
MTHYFTDNRDLPSREKELRISFLGKEYTFVTDIGVFSKNELDEGSAILLEAVQSLDISGSVLDLGCGYGPIGIITASMTPQCQVTMSDVNPRAVELAVKNCIHNGIQAQCQVSDGFEKIDNSFDVILTNPPIRAGKRVIYRLFEDACAHLNKEGVLLVVIRRKQGAESALAKLQEIFGNGETILRKRGYWILKAVRTDTDINK